MNTVNHTLYIPLFSKALASSRHIIIDDKMAEQIWEQNKIQLGRKSKSKWLSYFLAMRAVVFDRWVESQISNNTDVVILHIGCGLDSRIERLNGHAHFWFDIDLPEVIAEREKYYTEHDGYRMLSGNACKPNEWISQVSHKHTAVVVMEGISMYLPPNDLNGLFASLSEHFPSIHILMDVYTDLGARVSKYKNPIQDVGVWNVYGMDDPTKPIKTCSLNFVREHQMTPPYLVSQLCASEQFWFKHLFAGKFAQKIYKMYEYGN